MLCRCLVLLQLLAAVGLLGGCAGDGLRELMPAPEVFAAPGAEAFYERVPAARREASIDLLYITDRAPAAAAVEGASYGEARARRLAFGSARVRFLPQMGWDELARQSLTDRRAVRIELELGDVRELGRYPFEPYPMVRTAAGAVQRDPVVLTMHERAEAALQAEVQRRLATAPSKQVLLYVHGFNETFASAAYTAAELCHFLGRRDVCAFFTWPASAHGNPLISYTTTTESALYSVGHLTSSPIPGSRAAGQSPRCHNSCAAG